MILPLHDPPQLSSTIVGLGEINAGSSTLIVSNSIHPSASVTLTVYVAEHNDVTAAVPLPIGFPGVQLYT